MSTNENTEADKEKPMESQDADDEAGEDDVETLQKEDAIMEGGVDASPSPPEGGSEARNSKASEEMEVLEPDLPSARSEALPANEMTMDNADERDEGPIESADNVENHDDVPCDATVPCAEKDDSLVDVLPAEHEDVETVAKDGDRNDQKDADENGHDSDATEEASDDAAVVSDKSILSESQQGESPNKSGFLQDSTLSADSENERMQKDPIDREVDFEVDESPQKNINKSPRQGSPVKKKRKIDWSGLQVPKAKTVDPLLLLPFDQGWVRELVFRSTTSDGLGSTPHRQSDVYYHPPCNKRKLRSKVQVRDYLLDKNSDLKIQSFTFAKVSIYKEPYEVIRQAGSTPRGFAKNLPRTDEYQIHIGPGRPRGRGNLIRGRGRGRGRGVRRFSGTYKPAGTSGPDGYPNHASSDSMLGSPPNKLLPQLLHKGLGASPVLHVNSASNQSYSNLSRPPTARKRTGGNQLQKYKVFRQDAPRVPGTTVVKTVPSSQPSLCGLDCLGRGGMPPTLHCGVCMCLFHPECVGFIGHTRAAMFICSGCQSQIKVSKGSTVKTTTLHDTLSGKTTGANPVLNGGGQMMVVGTAKVSQTIMNASSPVPTGLFSHPPPLRPGGTPSPVTGPRPGNPPPLRAPPPPAPPISSAFQTVKASETSLLNLANMGNASQLSGQLLTLPSGVLGKLNMNQPLALKVKSQTLMIPPSCFVSTPEGVKVFLPTGTLPSQLFNQETAKAININLQNKQTLNVSSPQAQVHPSIDTQPTSVEYVQPDDDIQITTPPSQEKTNKRKRAKTINPAMCHFQKLHAGFDCMFCIFKYLPVADLLRVGRVCKTWHSVSSQHSLWKRVRLFGSRVADWEGAARHFKQFQTQALDMRGMALFEDKNRTWHQLTAVLDDMISLKQLDFGQSPASILHAVCEKLVDLEILTAEYITDSFQEPQMWSTNTKLDFGKFCKLRNLCELRVRGQCGLIMPSFSLTEGLSSLGKLTKLRVLSMTTLRDIPGQEFSFLGSLENLEFLEIGDCSLWTTDTYAELGKLMKLKTLRLECGGDFKDLGLGAALTEMKDLTQLELIHFVVADTVGTALKDMTHLKKLSVWPDMTSQAALVNSTTFKAVSEMSFLELLEWGIMTDNNTIILNEDTERSNGSDGPSKSGGDKSKMECIPFLAPSVANSDQKGGSEDGEGDSGVTPGGEVDLLPEYISIAELVGRLHTNLPDTKIRVFRVPVINTRATKATP